MQQEAARQHAQPASVGYGKNNPPVGGMAPQQQPMPPQQMQMQQQQMQQQQRMPMQQPMPNQAARMQLPAMNDWGSNRYGHWDQMERRGVSGGLMLSVFCYWAFVVLWWTGSSFSLPSVVLAIALLGYLRCNHLILNRTSQCALAVLFSAQ